MKTTDDDNSHFSELAIQFFRSLIIHRKDISKDTRPVNFAGNVGRKMAPKVKKWFTNRYPNINDYVKFFIENDSVFVYDPYTGNVDLSRDNGKPMARLELLRSLASKSSAKDLSLIDISDIAFEAELFLFVLKLAIDGYDLTKSRELKASQVVDIFATDPNLEKLCSKVTELIPQPIANPRIDCQLFWTNLMSYMSDNYPVVFEVDTHIGVIRLSLGVIERLKKFNEEVDESIYEILRNTLLKYIQFKGQPIDGIFAVDVDHLYERVVNRHPILVHRIFNRKISDDYNLLMFCESFPDSFSIRLKTINGKPYRYVCLNTGFTEEKLNPLNSNKEVDLDEEVYESDLYYSDDEEEERRQSFTLPDDVDPIEAAFGRLLATDPESDIESSLRNQLVDEIHDCKKVIDIANERIRQLENKLQSLGNSSDRLSSLDTTRTDRKDN